MNVPQLDFTIDITNDESLQKGAIQVLTTVRPSWKKENIRWKIYTDGITNKLIGLWANDNKNDTVLVRVYGLGTDMIIDRKMEILNMQRMRAINCGSELYATFNNGICYEFLDGDIMTQDDVWKEDIWRGVAKMMAKMHNVRLDKSDIEAPCLWNRLTHFINCCNPQNHPRLSTEFPTKADLIDEVESLRKRLGALGDKVVFCHNDLLLANVVIQDHQVNFIDLEYGAANYAAYDIANHFVEFVGCDGELDYLKWIPSRDWQLNWLKVYLEACSSASGDKEVNQIDVEKLQTKVEQFMLAAHLLWALWAVIQAENSSIDFDFEDYALQRFREFKRWKEVLGFA